MKPEVLSTICSLMSIASLYNQKICKDDERTECGFFSFCDRIVLCSGCWLERTRVRGGNDGGWEDALGFAVQTLNWFIVRSIQATRSIKQTEGKWNANTGDRREWNSHVICLEFWFVAHAIVITISS